MVAEVHGVQFAAKMVFIHGEIVACKQVAVIAGINAVQVDCRVSGGTLLDDRFEASHM